MTGMMKKTVGVVLLLVGSAAAKSDLDYNPNQRCVKVPVVQQEMCYKVILL